MNFRPLATIIMVLTGLLVFGPVANAGPVAIVGGGYNLGGAFSTLDVLSVDVLTLATSSLLTGLPSPAVGVAVGDGKLFTSDGTIVTVRLNPGGGPPTFVDDFDLPSLGDGWVYYDLSYWAGSLFAVADLVDQGLILQLDPSTGDIVSAWDLSHRITSLEIGSSLTGVVVDGLSNVYSVVLDPSSPALLSESVLFAPGLGIGGVPMGIATEGDASLASIFYVTDNYGALHTFDALGNEIGTGIQVYGNGVDTVEVTGLAAAIPEPATWAMMAAGLGLAVAGRRRGRKV
jgi:hypothetical protein